MPESTMYHGLDPIPSVFAVPSRFTLSKRKDFAFALRLDVRSGKRIRDVNKLKRGYCSADVIAIELPALSIVYVED